MDRWELDVSALDVQATFVASEAPRTLSGIPRMVSPFRIWNSYGVFIPRGKQLCCRQQPMERRGVTLNQSGYPATLGANRRDLRRIIPVWTTGFFTKDLAWRAFGWLV